MLDNIIPEFVLNRKEICKQCDKLIELNRCSICGCFMDVKVAIPSASCPDNKWLGINNNIKE